MGRGTPGSLTEARGIRCRVFQIRGRLVQGLPARRRAAMRQITSLEWLAP